MKKNYLTAIAILSTISFTSKAQTNTFPSSGNVGVGTTSPSEKLQVVGNARVDGIYPYFNLYNSAWGAHTYIQSGVDQIGNGAGNYLSFINPAGKGFAFSQGTTTAMTIGISGNVGIGTTSPAYKLDVNGPVNFLQNIFVRSNGVNSAECLLYKQNGGYYDLASNNDGFQLYNSNTNKAVIFSDVNDNIAIGASSTHGYKLAVNGSTIAESVTVKMYTDWPDYVFEPTYKLSSLAEIKTYVDKNHHLPEIPSAAEMAKNGLDLGDMNMKLLKKVEELTLYLIQKEKKDQEHDELLLRQQRQISRLTRQLRNQKH